MCRLRFVEPEDAGESVKKIFSDMVFVPNLLGVMANSEPVVESFDNLSQNLKNGLPGKYREMISLAVSQFNQCPYCLAWHTRIAVDSGILTEEECLDARRMESPDIKTDSLLKFIKEVLEKRGRVKDQILEEVRLQGFNDRDIIDAIAVVSLITMANYTANVSRPDLDFPEAPVLG